MRLSEAIRLGSMMKPQAFGNYFDRGGTCANGAALDAVGYVFDPEQDCNEISADAAYALRARFPIVLRLPEICPSCDAVWADWWGTNEFKIAHLNDSHRWTRERIADWVESIERAQESDRLGAETAEPALATQSEAQEV